MTAFNPNAEIVSLINIFNRHCPLKVTANDFPERKYKLAEIFFVCPPQKFVDTPYALFERIDGNHPTRRFVFPLVSIIENHKQSNYHSHVIIPNYVDELPSAYMEHQLRLSSALIPTWSFREWSNQIETANDLVWAHKAWADMLENLPKAKNYQDLVQYFEWRRSAWKIRQYMMLDGFALDQLDQFLLGRVMRADDSWKLRRGTLIRTDYSAKVDPAILARIESKLAAFAASLSLQPNKH